MKTFEQFLIEARMAPLYHGTAFNNIEKISKVGILGATIHNTSQGAIQGISLSRQFEFASKWAYLNNTNYVVIEFDQQKIAQRYKISPIRYAGFKYNSKASNNEFEEFVITKSLPLSLATKIHYYVGAFFDKKEKENYEEYMEELLERHPHLTIVQMKKSKALDFEDRFE